MVCLVVAFLAFWPGLAGGFLNFDDPRTVTENPAFLEGGFAGLRRILDPRETIADVYLPVTYLSLWADVAVSNAMHGVNGLAVSSGGVRAALPSMTLLPHVHSLVLHGLAAFLLLRVLVHLRLPTLACYAGALAFAAHPALAESVVWISSRKDVLSGLLVLLALVIGQGVVLRGRSAWPVFVLAVFACYAKATAVVLPLLGLGLWWWTAHRARPEGVDGASEDALPIGEGGRIVRLVLGSGFVCALATLHHGFLAAQAGTSDFVAQPAALPGTFVHYLQVASWPAELAVHRSRDLLDAFAENVGLKALWLAVLVLAALVVIRRGRPALGSIGVGVLLFFAALLPFNGVKPAFAIAAADRYLYLALPGLALVVAGVCHAMPARGRTLGTGLAAVAILALCVPRARARALDFTTSDRLWNANLEVYPRDDVSLINLGEWKYATGDPDAADALFERAGRVVTEPVIAMRIASQRHLLAMARGRLDTARMHLERAIDIADDRGRQFLNARVDLRIQLIDLLDRLDRPEDARAVVEEVLAIAPEHPAALGRKASLELAQIARNAKALPLSTDDEELRGVARILDRAFAQPRVLQTASPVTARAEWHRLRGETSAASRVLDDYKGNPHESLVLQRARIYGSEGLTDEAIQELQRGLAAHRDSIRVPRQLADLLLRGRRFAEAERVLAQLHARYPEHEQIARKFGTALVEHARALVGKEEVADFAPRIRKAAALVPENPRLPLLEALLLGEEQRFVAALGRVRLAKKHEPEDVKVEQVLQGLLKRCGWVFFAAGDTKQAFALWRELLRAPKVLVDVAAVRESYTRELERRSKKATSKMLAADFRAACKAWERVLELEPDSANALVQLGVALYASGDYKNAEKRLAQAVRASESASLDPGLALLYRMRSLDQLERSKDAVELGEAYLRSSKTRVGGSDELRKRVRSFVDRLRAGG